jgi:hypothetical protein
LNRLGFDPSVLQSVGTLEREIPVSFVGSLTPHHASRLRLIEELACKTDLAMWGRAGGVDSKSPIWPRYRGEAWGRDMYEILARSKLTINQHIDIAEGFANNMRLYEATGMGALLITDWKSNIAEIFEPGKEVICYHDAEECIELIRYFLANEPEREKIAKAGQDRVLKDHNYKNRVIELNALFEDRLRAKKCSSLEPL